MFHKSPIILPITLITFYYMFPQKRENCRKQFLGKEKLLGICMLECMRKSRRSLVYFLQPLPPHPHPTPRSSVMLPFTVCSLLLESFQMKVKGGVPRKKEMCLIEAGMINHVRRSRGAFHSSGMYHHGGFARSNPGNLHSLFMHENKGNIQYKAHLSP